MEPTLEFVRVDESHVCVRRAGSDDEVKCNSKTDAILSRMDVGDLTESQQERLQEAIGRYQSTFSEDEDDLGFCDLVNHKIVTPASTTAPEVRDYIQKSLDQGIIRESSSLYASPIVLVRKKDGKLRLCDD
ncbi:uncharacterized protein [Montipora foliosa]|uniref:uncharacterized protein n=1 Tax=Montipora foliosa TaxID=591990 RepID=UPI0035F158B7